MINKDQLLVNSSPRNKKESPFALAKNCQLLDVGNTATNDHNASMRSSNVDSSQQF